MNKNLSVSEAPGGGGGVHVGHIQCTHYSSEGEDKRISFSYNDMAAILTFLILFSLFIM